MNTTIELEQLAQACDDYVHACHTLAERIIVDDAQLPALYLIDNERYQGSDARAYLSRWACDYAHEPLSGHRFGLLQASPQTLPALTDFNRAGVNAAQIYTAYKNSAWTAFSAEKNRENHAISESTATKLAREGLTEIGHDAIDFVRARIHATLIPNSPIRVRWFFENKKNSSRKTMKDAVEELEKQMEGASEERIAAIRQEISSLKSSSFDPDEIVAKVKKTRVKQLRATVVSFDSSNHQSTTFRLNGAMPFFCEQLNLEALDIALPARVRKSGGGRRSLISDEPVSETLGSFGWFRYKEQTTTAHPVKPTLYPAVKESKRYPAMQLAMHGLKITLRKRRDAEKLDMSISYTHNSRTQKTRVSLETLDASWTKAAQKAHKINPSVNQRAFINAQPTRNDVAEWLNKQRSDKSAN